MLRKYWIEISLFLLANIAFFVVQLLSGNFLTDDSFDYLQTADNLLNDQILYSADLDAEIFPEYYTWYTPGYPFLLVLFRLLTQSLIPVIVFQVLISLGSFLLLLKTFQPGKAGSILLVFLSLFFPAQFIYANLLVPEILLQFIIMAAVLQLFRFIQTENIRILWSYQSLLILAILIKPMLSVFVVPNILVFIILYAKSKQRLVFISSLIPVVFLIIFAGINQQRTGYFHISSIHKKQLVEEKLYPFLLERDGEEIANENSGALLRECTDERDFKSEWQCLSSSTRAIIREDLQAYTFFHLKGSFYFFLDPGQAVIEKFFENKSQIASKQDSKVINEGLIVKRGESHGLSSLMYVFLLLILGINVLRVIGFLFFLFNRRVNGSFRLYLFLLITSVALFAGPMGSAENQLAIILLLTGSASFQYSVWMKRLFVFLRKKKSDH